MSYFRDFQRDVRPKGLGDDDTGNSRETRYIRLRRITIGGVPRNVAIRLVETRERIDAACDLINDRYAWRGYGASHRILFDAYHLTFTVEIDEQVVGTITLAVDSPQGLAADRIFRDEIDGFRALPEAKVCELTKFAFDAHIQSKELMAALFHIVFVYGHRTYGCTDLFIEVNPRHVRFYEAMLGFEKVGALVQNESVSAPSQLMWLKVGAIREYINRAAGKGTRDSGRSLYPFFFSPTDEGGIYLRLVNAGPKPMNEPEASIQVRTASRSLTKQIRAEIRRSESLMRQSAGGSDRKTSLANPKRRP